MKKILPPTLLFICLVAMVLLAWIVPIQWLSQFSTNLLGVAPLAMGLFISVSAERQFAKVGTNVNTFNEPDVIVMEGWFSRSRNPMYLGMVLILIGAWVLLGSVSPILGVLIFVVVSDRWYILIEETKMTAKFGQTYEEYKRRVRRWI
jgi:protein-S-isoprenylcysteine O-methyltransferase Ste14